MFAEKGRELVKGDQIHPVVQIQARRLMLQEKLDAATAAFEVGYENPAQFSREYKRTFGLPPKRDITKLLQMLSNSLVSGTQGA